MFGPPLYPVKKKKKTFKYQIIRDYELTFFSVFVTNIWLKVANQELRRDGEEYRLPVQLI